MYHIHITVIIAVPWQNAHWLTGRLIFVIDAPVEVLAAAAQGHSHDVEKGPEKSSKSKKEWMSEKDKKIWTNATASATDMLSCVQYLLQYSQDTVLQYHTVSQHHSITMYHPSESPVLSNKFHRNVAVSLPRRQPRPRRAQQPVLNVCSTCAHSGQENRKHTLENFSKILKHWRVYRASLPNGMQIAHARAYKELKWSLITYVQVLTFHPLFYSFLEVNTSFDVDWPTLASASTQLRKRFRSGRRSWWSPSARQRSSAQTFGKNRLKLGFHVLVLHSFDLCMTCDSVLLKLLYLFLEWT